MVKHQNVSKYYGNHCWQKLFKFWQPIEVLILYLVRCGTLSQNVRYIVKKIDSYFITKCYFITKGVMFFMTKCDSFITICNCYYKMCRFYYKWWQLLKMQYLLQNALVHLVTMILMIYYKAPLFTHIFFFLWLDLSNFLKCTSNLNTFSAF